LREHFAVLSDVHANALALQACLERIRAWEFKNNVKVRRIFLGDLLDAGPLPELTLQLALEAGEIFILGNHEEYVLECWRHPHLKKYQDPLWKLIPWSVKKITSHPESLARLRAYEKSCVRSYSLPSGNVHFLHASAESTNKNPKFFPVQKGSKETPLPQDFSSFYAALYFAGHNHYAGIYENTQRAHGPHPEIWVNCGSVGYPFVAGSESEALATFPIVAIDAAQNHVDVHFQVVSFSQSELAAQWKNSGAWEECAPFSFAIAAQALFHTDIVYPFFAQVREKNWNQKELPTRLKQELQMKGWMEKLLALGLPVLIFLLIFLIQVSNVAQAAESWDPKGRRISEIEVRGLIHTEKTLILQELAVQEGTPFAPENLEESLRRLRNMRIFRSAAGHTTVLPEGEVRITLDVEERWTLIPVARFGGGGGAAFLVVGAYELNFLGRYLDLGGQYENHSGIPGGSVWFRDPRFLGRRQKVSWEGSSLGKLRRQYDSQSGKEVSAFVRRRQRLAMGWEREWSRKVVIGTGVEGLFDQYTSAGLLNEDKINNQKNNFALPKSGFHLGIPLRLLLGEMNYDDYLLQGVSFDAKSLFLKGTGAQNASEKPFGLVTLETLAFWRWGATQNSGFRFGILGTGSGKVENAITLGGLEHIRGFKDGEFQGARAWYLNLEHRVPSFKWPSFVFQHVFFYDAGDARPRFAELQVWRKGMAQSVGTGLRLLVPPIARLNLRMDYAFAITPHPSQGLVFGMQQFF
jgi:hypothetical protein